VRPTAAFDGRGPGQECLLSNRIKTNLNSLIAQRNLTRHSRALDERSAKLSSGKRITRASDDAAGLAISQYINAQVRGTRQASRNAQDAISIVQIAEGSLNELGNIVTRMRELTIQGVSDTVSTNEREMINIEIQQMKKRSWKNCGGSTME
jgi:flagellin